MMAYYASTASKQVDTTSIMNKIGHGAMLAFRLDDAWARAPPYAFANAALEIKIPSPETELLACIEVAQVERDARTIRSLHDSKTDLSHPTCPARHRGSRVEMMP